MKQNFYKLGTFLFLLVQMNVSIAQTNVWGVGSGVGVADAQFANSFVQATAYNAGDNPSSWTALTVSQSGGSVTPGNAYWVRSTTGTSQGAYWGTQPAIASPSVGNGVALFDSDFMDNNGTAGAFGTGSSPSSHKGQLISPRIDLTGYTNAPLRVFFYEKLRNYQITDLSISFSVDDGATWGTTIPFQNLPPVNAVFEGTEALNLTSATNGISDLTQCRLRFTFNGDYYYAMIDDISIQHLCSTASTISPVVCNNYTSPSGSYTWTASGSYLDTIPNFAGCDSVISINLTINTPATGSQTLTVCAGGAVTVGSNTYTSNGTYTDVLTAANGCDSTVTTNLTVDPAIDITVTNASPVLTANQTGATYQWLDCNNSNQAIAGETNQNYTATVSGSYAVEITVGNCVDTSACEIVSVTSIYTYAENIFSVYPNPSRGSFTMNLTAASKIEITNALGQLVYEKQLNSGKQAIDLTNVVEGVYFVKVISGNQQGVKRMVISK